VGFRAPVLDRAAVAKPTSISVDPSLNHPFRKDGDGKQGLEKGRTVLERVVPTLGLTSPLTRPNYRSC